MSNKNVFHLEDLKMSINPLRLAILESGKKQLEISLNTGIYHTRLNLIINGWISPNERERQLIAVELGKTAEELFPDQAIV